MTRFVRPHNFVGFHMLFKVRPSIANCRNIGAASEHINEMRTGLVVKRGLA
jgi:hypothetical protein